MMTTMMHNRHEYMTQSLTPIVAEGGRWRGLEMRRSKKNPNKCDDSLGDNDSSNTAAAVVTKGAGVINKRTESKHLGELFQPSSPHLTPSSYPSPRPEPTYHKSR